MLMASSLIVTLQNETMTWKKISVAVFLLFQTYVIAVPPWHHNALNEMVDMRT